MRSRDAIKTDLPFIRLLLSNSNLPSDDFVGHIDTFVVIEENETVIATGGLEITGKEGLLRSIVVAPEYRRNDIAKKIYQLLELKAKRSGINMLYLITESAVNYFSNLGFFIIDRTDLPFPVMETKQFKELCPSTAIVMCRKILK